jgi:hypothetical protein
MCILRRPGTNDVVHFVRRRMYTNTLTHLHYCSTAFVTHSSARTAIAKDYVTLG